MGANNDYLHMIALCYVLQPKRKYSHDESLLLEIYIPKDALCIKNEKRNLITIITITIKKKKEIRGKNNF